MQGVRMSWAGGGSQNVVGATNGVLQDIALCKDTLQKFASPTSKEVLQSIQDAAGRMPAGSSLSRTWSGQSLPATPCRKRLRRRGRSGRSASLQVLAAQSPAWASARSAASSGRPS